MIGRERRRFGRTPHPVEIAYRLHSDLTSPWTRAIAVNLSAGGVRFRCQEPFQAGDELQLRLQLSGSQRPVEVEGQVIWNQLQASGVNEVGLEFFNVTAQQQLQIDELVQFLGTDPTARPPE
jgi:c-di-GMP-binding flagellar brake protein YcgR